MWNDVRFALRTLRHSPVFTLAALLSLALGIGANTAIFSLIYQVAMRSLPVREPATLVSLETEFRGDGWSRGDTNRALFSYPMYEAIRDHNAVFSGVMGRTSTPATLAWESQSVRASAEVVTGNFFTLLGLEPALGRLLAPEDEARSNPVIVLGYDYWVSRMGSSPSVLNSQIRLNGHPVVVVGVAPRAFRGVVSGQTPDIYIPASLMPIASPGWQRTRAVNAYWLNLFARLKPGVSTQQANAELAPLFQSIVDDQLKEMPAHKRKEAAAKPLMAKPAAQGVNVLRDQWESSLFLMSGIVGLVLLIACANVASLMLVRSAVREREMAVRAALGASAWQIARLLLVECMVLALAGGVLGVFVCEAATDGLLQLLPADSTGNWLTAQWDGRVFLFSIGLAVLTGLLFGLLPAVSAARANVAPAIKNQNSGLTSGEHHARSRQVFVAGQICLSFLLLVGAGLLTRTLANLMSSDPGFRADHLVTYSLDAVLSGHSQTQARVVYRQIEDRLRSHPEVSSVSKAAFAPFAGSAWGNGVKAPGSRTANDKYITCLQNAIGAAYFRTLGTPLLVGREFDDRDTTSAPKVAVINETFARLLFESGNPIGRIIRTGSNDLDLQIVGVVKDSKYGGVREKPGPMLYVPFEQAEPEFSQQAWFFIRTRADERQMMASATAIVKQLAPGVPITRMSTMRMVVEESIHRQRLIAILAMAFAGLAVLLAAAGVYGAAAYSGARRIREFGIHLALGAEPKAVLRLAMREVLILTGIGIAVGLPVSFALARVLESGLYGVAAHDPLTLTGAAVLIGAVALLAALRPGLHAMRIDPVNALRHE